MSAGLQQKGRKTVPEISSYVKPFVYPVTSLVAQMVKNLTVLQETLVQSLGLRDPLEKGMATHSSILAWRISRTEKPGGYSPWGHKESNKTEHNSNSNRKTARDLSNMVNLIN